MGHAGYGAGAGNFGIGTDGPGLCLSISSTGTLNVHQPAIFNSSLTLGGSSAATKPWISGRVSCRDDNGAFTSLNVDSGGKRKKNRSCGMVGEITVSSGAPPILKGKIMVYLCQCQAFTRNVHIRVLPCRVPDWFSHNP